MDISLFLIYVITMTFSPGPNNVLSLTSSTQSSYKKTLPFMMGIASGFFIIMILTSVLNYTVIEYIPNVKPVLKVLGAIYILYLAIAIHGVFGKKKNKDNKTTFSYLSGLTLQFVNPKVILYGLTTFSVFIIPNYGGYLTMIFFSFLLAFTSFCSINTWAVVGSILKRWIDKYQLQFNIAMSVFLIYTALMILLE